MSAAIGQAHSVAVHRSVLEAGGWRDLLFVLCFALLLRVLLFNGAFGSDDAVYFARALDVATGSWTSADYNGALRYGFNIPAGLFIFLFGTSIAVANLWPLLCSLAEIALVFWMLRELEGRRASIIGGLLLSTVSLHISVATRIHADAVVSFCLTAAFFSVFMSLRRRSDAWAAIAGVALGGVYWSKELAPVTYFAFLPFLYYFRNYFSGIAWTLAGLLLMLGANGLLMFWIAGDPLHPVKVVLSAMNRNFIEGGAGEDGPLYYLRYLYVDVRHVGLLGVIATLGVLTWLRDFVGSARVRTSQLPFPGSGFAVLWLIGLLLVLSLFPVSLSPLRFTMKQSNYISLFLAPLTIMAVLAVSRWPRRHSVIVVGVAMSLNLLFAALQQADYRSFTANSKAIAQMMIGRSDSLLVGNRNNSGIAAVISLEVGKSLGIVSYREASADPVKFEQRVSGVQELLAAVDPQTASWGAGPTVVTQPMPCWILVAEVQPVGLGLGNVVASGLAEMSAALPGTIMSRLSSATRHIAAPAAARIYRVPGRQLWCQN